MTIIAPLARAGAAVLVAISLQGCLPDHGLTDDQLLTLRTCESGGNYRAVSKKGTFRGAYQFTRSTWAGIGGTGDPAEAPEWEQDERARDLYERDGASPWPVCGRRL